MLEDRGVVSMETSNLVEAIVGWLKGRLSEVKADGLVVGLSGGVDSAVVGALCKRAAGENALGVVMPCHSQPYDVECALKFARGIALDVLKVELDEIHDAFLKALPEGSALARANLKPRLRMAALYFIANTCNYLVAGTGNKSESMVGYFTKYGDGGVDILPIGDLLKREVVELARSLGVPQEIIHRPPSAGLWPGQTDEGELGLSYAELDEALEAMERGKEGGVEPAALEKVRQLIRLSEHKRRPPLIFKRDNAR